MTVLLFFITQQEIQAKHSHKQFLQPLPAAQTPYENWMVMLAIATAPVLMTYHPDQTSNAYANRQMDKTGPDLKTFFDSTAELYMRKGLILILDRIIPPEP